MGFQCHQSPCFLSWGLCKVHGACGYRAACLLQCLLATAVTMSPCSRGALQLPEGNESDVRGKWHVTGGHALILAAKVSAACCPHGPLPILTPHPAMWHPLPGEAAQKRDPGYKEPGEKERKEKKKAKKRRKSVIFQLDPFSNLLNCATTWALVVTWAKGGKL